MITDASLQAVRRYIPKHFRKQCTDYHRHTLAACWGIPQSPKPGILPGATTRKSYDFRALNKSHFPHFYPNPFLTFFINIVLTDFGPLHIFMFHRLASPTRYRFGMLIQFSMFGCYNLKFTGFKCLIPYIRKVGFFSKKDEFPRLWKFLLTVIWDKGYDIKRTLVRYI